jgi:hypothetical protein
VHTADASWLRRLGRAFKRGPIAAIATKVMEIRHPGSLESIARPLQLPPGAPGERLKPSSALKSRRYGWPEQSST